MRAILAIALVLLPLTWLSNHVGDLHRRTGDLRADAALEIVVGAKGPLLPSALIGTGPERIGEAMRLGDRTLVPHEFHAGLRSALLATDFSLREERCYEIAASVEEARALRRRVETADEGSLLILASSGRIEPQGNDAAAIDAELTVALEQLGARARPGTHTPESWALIALRLERGWVPLAEGYSQDSGVALSFVLSPELESYAHFSGDFARMRAPQESQVLLDEELHYASRRDPGVEPVRDRTVANQTLAAIRQHPRVDAQGGHPSALVWRDVALGTGSGFLAWVGLDDEAAAGSDGVVFELVVDGTVVHSMVVLPGAPWKAFLADLRPFAGRAVELELRIDPRATAVGDDALWGRPMLFHGYDRSPLETLERR